MILAGVRNQRTAFASLVLFVVFSMLAGHPQAQNRSPRDDNSRELHVPPITDDDSPKSERRKEEIQSWQMLGAWDQVTSAKRAPAEELKAQGRLPSNSMNKQERAMIELTNMAQGVSEETLGDRAAGVASLLLQLAEYRMSFEETRHEAENFLRYETLRASLSQNSQGLEVVLLSDKNTDLITAAVSADYWKNHHEALRGENGVFPESHYEVWRPSTDRYFYTGAINPSYLAPFRGSYDRPPGVKADLPAVITDRESLRQYFEYKNQHTYWEAVPTEQTEKDQIPYNSKYDVQTTVTTTYEVLRHMQEIALPLNTYNTAVLGDSGFGSIGGVLFAGSAHFSGDAPDAIFAAKGRLYGRVHSRIVDFEDIDPSEFAVALRMIAVSKQAPELTIGTEPSDRTGYQKVSYSPGIYNSSVGRAMMQADQRLKGIMADIGLGPGGRSSGANQTFFSSFPQPTRALRLWFTNEAVLFVESNKHFTAQALSLRLHYEEFLRDQPVNDPDINSFITEFHRRIKSIVDEVPEFGQLERLARTTALARWVAVSGVIVDPGIWILPFDLVETPGYVPAACTGSHSGGIDLSGRKGAPPISLGVLAPLAIEGILVGRRNTGVGLAPYELILAVLLSLLSAALLLRLRKGMTYSRSLQFWLKFLLLLFLLDLAETMLIFPYILGEFDAEFLSVLMIVVLPGGLLGWLAFSKTGVSRTTRIPRLSIQLLRWQAVGAIGALSLALLSAATTRVMLLNRDISPFGLRMLNVAAAPAEIFSRPWTSGDQANFMLRVHFLPASVVRSTQYRFSMPDEKLGEDSGVFFSDGTIGPVGIVEMQRVSDPDLITKEPIYTVDGRPPY